MGRSEDRKTHHIRDPVQEYPPCRSGTGQVSVCRYSRHSGYEIDFRILFGSDIRWISARGQGDDADIADRTMFGIFLDVTQRKQAEEANELLAGEMSHRVKNLLTIATALTQFTSRSAATKEDMAHELTNRLMALGRAQDLIRPVPGRKNEGTLLGDLVSV